MIKVNQTEIKINLHISRFFNRYAANGLQVMKIEKIIKSKTSEINKKTRK